MPKDHGSTIPANQATLKMNARSLQCGLRPPSIVYSSARLRPCTQPTASTLFTWKTWHLFSYPWSQVIRSYVKHKQGHVSEFGAKASEQGYTFTSDSPRRVCKRSLPFRCPSLTSFAVSLFSRNLLFLSPGPQRWQNWQAKPVAHPFACKNAHGLHSLVAWRDDPTLGRGGGGGGCGAAANVGADANTSEAARQGATTGCIDALSTLGISARLP